MKEDKLLNSLSFISEDLIEEAMQAGCPSVTRVSFVRRHLPKLAAAAVLLAAGAILLFHGFGREASPDQKGPGALTQPAEGQMTAPAADASGSGESQARASETTLPSETSAVNKHVDSDFCFVTVFHDLEHEDFPDQNEPDAPTQPAEGQVTAPAADAAGTVESQPPESETTLPSEPSGTDKRVDNAFCFVRPGQENSGDGEVVWSPAMSSLQGLPIALNWPGENIHYVFSADKGGFIEYAKQTGTEPGKIKAFPQRRTAEPAEKYILWVDFNDQSLINSSHSPLIYRDYINVLVYEGDKITGAALLEVREVPMYKGFVFKGRPIFTEKFTEEDAETMNETKALELLAAYKFNPATYEIKQEPYPQGVKVAPEKWSLASDYAPGIAIEFTWPGEAVHMDCTAAGGSFIDFDYQAEHSSAEAAGNNDFIRCTPGQTLYWQNLLPGYDKKSGLIEESLQTAWAEALVYDGEHIVGFVLIKIKAVPGEIKDSLMYQAETVAAVRFPQVEGAFQPIDKAVVQQMMLDIRTKNEG